MRVREGQQKFLRLSFPEGQANLLSTGVWSVARGVVEGDKRTYPRARSPGGPLRLRLGVPEAQAQARTRHTRITREREADRAAVGLGRKSKGCAERERDSALRSMNGRVSDSAQKKKGRQGHTRTATPSMVSMAGSRAGPVREQLSGVGL
jgi:hypothetical protein